MSTKVNRVLHLRQFLSDVVPATDLWPIFCGAAVALVLAWLF